MTNLSWRVSRECIKKYREICFALARAAHGRGLHRPNNLTSRFSRAETRKFDSETLFLVFGGGRKILAVNFPAGHRRAVPVSSRTLVRSHARVGRMIYFAAYFFVPMCIYTCAPPAASLVTRDRIRTFTGHGARQYRYRGQNVPRCILAMSLFRGWRGGERGGGGECRRVYVVDRTRSVAETAFDNARNWTDVPHNFANLGKLIAFVIA